MQQTWVQSLGWKDPLEKGMTTHSSILAWRMLWAEEPSGLQAMGLHRIGHDWATNTFTLIWNRKEKLKDTNWESFMNERAQLPPAPLFTMVTSLLGTTAPEGPWWALWDPKLYVVRFSRRSVPLQKWRSPSPENLWGLYESVSTWLVSKWTTPIHDLHFPQAWAYEQRLPCLWGQNVMLGRVISALVLGPRSSKTSPLAWLTGC